MANQILGIFRRNMHIRYSQKKSYAHIEHIKGALKKNAPQWNFLAQHYGTGKNGGVYIGFDDDGNPRRDNGPPWQEINFGSQNPTVCIERQEIFVAGEKLDSYTIQAQRKGKLLVKNSDVIENAIQGILVKDGQFLLGVRGGQDQPDKLNVLPGGSVQYKDTYRHDPFTDAFIVETKEEAGTGVKGYRFCGVFNQRGVHTNRQWVYVGYPSKDLKTIMTQHKKGIEFYTRVKKETGNEAYARKLLENTNFPKDAWDNNTILPFSFTAETFLKLLKLGHIYNGRHLKLIGSLPATLYIVGCVYFGKKFKDTADRLPLVQQEVLFH